MDKSQLRRTPRKSQKAAESAAAALISIAGNASTARTTTKKKSRKLLSKRRLSQKHNKKLEAARNERRKPSPLHISQATPCPRSSTSPIDLLSSPPPIPNPSQSPQSPPPSSFEYPIQWLVTKVGAKKEVVKSDLDHRNTEEGFFLLHEWLKTKIRHMVDAELYTVLRTELSVCQSAGRPHPNDVKVDFSDSHECTEKLLKAAMQHHKAKRNIPRVVVTIFVTPHVPTATPRPNVRSTPTSQMLLQSNAVEVDNSALSITSKWICSQKGCKNYDRHCYWSIRDSPDHHLPLLPEPLKMWTAAIREGIANAEQPPASVVYRLTALRFQRSAPVDGSSNAKKRRHANSISEAKVPIINVNFGGTGQDVPPWLRSYRGPSPPKRLSPELLSSQTAPMDLVVEFFQYCKGSRLWSLAEHEDLDLINSFVEDGGYDLEGLKNVGESRWKEASLKEGHRMRISASLRKFYAQRNRPRSRSSEDEPAFT